jgi:hypothetical protein
MRILRLDYQYLQKMMLHFKAFNFGMTFYTAIVNYYTINQAIQVQSTLCIKNERLSYPSK